MGALEGIARNQHFIAGAWEDGGAGVHAVLDKYDGSTIVTFGLATAGQVERAVAMALAAKGPLAKTSAGKRAALLHKLADLLEGKRAEFVDLIVREAGKPISYAQTEVDRGVMTLRIAAGESTRGGGEYVPMDFGIGEGKTAFTKRFPVGVVLGITPFNFPLNLVLHKVAPALAAGCPIIVKPAPQSPLTTFALAALVEKAGFEPGAFQALLCDNALAESMVRDARIAMLSFTGSDKVGWQLKALAGKKRVALELGGNAAVIVDETADIAKAAAATCAGAYLYAGQICISTQRIYVVAAVRAAFEAALLAEIAKVRSGDPHDASVINGPIIDEGHLHRIDQWVLEAVADGAKLLAGGQILDARHHIYAPTLLTGTHAGMKVCTEEVFGPVAILETAGDFEEAIQKVNESRFGLQVGIFTQRIDRAKLALEQLEVGGIIIGGVPGFRVDSMPYGGVKDSGLGREGLRYAMEEMTEPRLMVF